MSLKIVTVAIVFAIVGFYVEAHHKSCKGKVLKQVSETWMDGEDSSICCTLRALCKKTHLFCDDYRKQCKSKKTTIGSTTTISTDNPYCLDCVAQCHNKDRACIRDWTFCDTCMGPCNSAGYEVFAISSAVAFMNHNEMCNWCFSMCFGANPDCYHEYCYTCEPQCLETTTTSTTIVTGNPYCVDCVDQCHNTDRACIRDWSFCDSCMEPCNLAGYEVYQYSSDVAFGNLVEMCNWCSNMCFGNNPDCYHGYCSTCEPECSATTTTSSSIVTGNPYCQDCKDQCHSKDRACIRDWSFCDSCMEPCNLAGYEIYQISSAIAFMNDQEKCDWCSNMCFGNNPDCYHGYCPTCEPECSGTTTISTTVSTTDSYCNDCTVLCEYRDLNCQTTSPICFDCAPDCGVRIVRTHPPADDPCPWCRQNCYGQRPECNHIACSYCEEQCSRSTQTTPFSTSTT